MKKINKIKKIIVTGGGTGGHVFPAIQIAIALKREGTDVLYLGSKNGLEVLHAKVEGIKFHSIHTGKLRRYFHWKNFVDPFFILYGIFESMMVIIKMKPNIVFSKGGYVSVPVVIAAKLSGIPVVLHESDLTPGLANKILIPFADKICLSFEKSKEYVSSEKSEVTGNPVRKEIFNGYKNKALVLTGFSEELPTLLVLGGSLGSFEINDLISDTIGELTEFCQVILQCGKGKNIKIDKSKIKENRFFQVEFVGVNALANLFALSDMVVGRAGAGQISELAGLGKPVILIPLGLSASRGDQIMNAEILESESAALVYRPEIQNKKEFVQILKSLIEDTKLKNKLVKNIKKFQKADSVRRILRVLKGSIG